MNIQAEVSLYPLGNPEIGKTIDAFIDGLSHPGVTMQKGNMSTNLNGELPDVFAALRAAFEEIINDNAAVLVVKMSNACPPHAPLSQGQSQ
ncbi:MAG: thiamine-binding protein [Candidatus Omnitrophica bacterium]|nr:thiamine-binding protein [Candidatus Omnitrophota bacterium]